MTHTLLFSAAEASDGGNAFLGFLLLAGIIWLICAACSSKPKGWDIEGKIRPR